MNEYFFAGSKKCETICDNFFEFKFSYVDAETMAGVTDSNNKMLVFISFSSATRCILVLTTCLLTSQSASGAFAASNNALLDSGDKFKPAEWGAGPVQAPPSSSSSGGSSGSSGSNDIEDKCFDEKLKKPIACVPDFVNAAYGLPVVASSTCGDPAKQFCSLTKDR